MPCVFIDSSLLVMATHTSRLTALQTGWVRVQGVFSLPSALISLDCTPKTQPLSLQQQRAEWGAQLCQLSCGVSVKTFHVNIQIPVILTPSCTLCKRMEQIGKQANGHTPDVGTTCCSGTLSRLCNKYGNSTSFKTMENKAKTHLWENDRARADSQWNTKESLSNHFQTSRALSSRKSCMETKQGWCSISTSLFYKSQIIPSHCLQAKSIRIENREHQNHNWNL